MNTEDLIDNNQKNVEEEEQLTFLFVQICGIPDIIVASQACQDIARNHRNPRIVFIVQKGCKEIVEGLEQVNEVYEFDEFGEHKGFFGMIKFLMSTKIGKIDYSFSAYGLDKALQIAWLLGAKEKYCYEPIDFMTKFVNMAKPNIQEYTNETNFAQDLQNWFNLTLGEFPYAKTASFKYPKDVENSVESKLSQVGLAKYPTIAICPCSKNEKNNWSAQEVAKLIDLVYPLGKRILLIGNKEDNWFVKEVKALTENPFGSLMGNLSPFEIAAMANRVEMFVSVHCDFMHLGYASGANTICMFFNTKEFYKWAPKEHANAVVLHRPEGLTAEKCFEFIQDFLRQQADEN